MPDSVEDEEFTTTEAPFAARRRAMAAPMPLEEPVTRAALESRRWLIGAST
jgi:hypothetical protein